MNITKTILTAVVLSTVSVVSNAAVTINSNNSGGTARQITTSAGVNVSNAILQIGYFVGAPTGGAGNLQAVRDSFTVLGTGGSLGTSLQSGNPTTVAGQFTVGATTSGRFSGVTVSNITGTNTPAPGAPSPTTLVQGTRLFILIYTPTEYTIFSDAALWLAPKDDPAIPGGASLTLAANFANLDTASAANEVLWGSYATPVSGTNQLRLAPIIPEPSSLVFGLLGGLLFAARRRK
jgi:hypothetical protein